MGACPVISEKNAIPIISVFHGCGADWTWFAKETQGRAIWDFHTEIPKTWIERKITRPRLSRIMGAIRCVRSAKRRSSVAVAALSQFNTMWTVIAMKLLGPKVPLLSFAFHFSKLPTGLRLKANKMGLFACRSISGKFRSRKRAIAKHFGIPVERFDFVRWGVEVSSVKIEDAPRPMEPSYISALGKDGRDYATLVAAMKQVPELTLVLVVQPYNLNGVDIPENVKVYCNIPRDQALNILKHSQFMALPLESRETSCGHITLVSAMFCHKAILATQSSGIVDYFPDGYDAPSVPPGDVSGWVRGSSGNGQQS